MERESDVRKFQARAFGCAQEGRQRLRSLNQRWRFMRRQDDELWRITDLKVLVRCDVFFQNNMRVRAASAKGIDSGPASVGERCAVNRCFDRFPFT